MDSSSPEEIQQHDTGPEIESLGTTHPTMAAAVVMEMTTFSNDAPAAFVTSEAMPPGVPISEPLPVAVAVTSPDVLPTASIHACAGESLHTKVSESVQQPRLLSCCVESLVA